MDRAKPQLGHSSKVQYLPKLNSFLVRLGLVILVAVGLLVGVVSIVLGDAVLGGLAAGVLALAGVAGWQLWRQRPSPMILAGLSAAVVGAFAPFLDQLVGVALLIGLAAWGGSVALLTEQRPALYYTAYLGLVIILSLLASYQRQATVKFLALFVVGVSFFGMATAYDQIGRRIRGSEQRYRDLFESAADSIITMDRNSRIVLFNAQAELVFGYRTAEIIGEPLAMLMPDRFREAHPTNVEGFADGRVSELKMGALRKVTGLRSNGEEFPIEVTVSKRLVKGEAEFTAVVRDVTGPTVALEQRELLHECVAAIASSPDADTAIAEALRRVCEYGGWLVGEAWIPSTDASRLEAGPAFHQRAEESSALRSLTELLTFEPGVGLAGRVWDTKQALVIPSIADDPDWVGSEVAAASGVRAAVGVPVLAGGEVVAILVFLLAAAPSDSPQLVDTISTVAAQLGSTIRQKLAEETLRVTGARSRAMIEALPDQYFRLSSDGIYLEFQIPDRSGFFSSAERFVGKHIDEALPPELAVELSAASVLARESGQVQLWEYRYEMNGLLREREARVFPIPETDETMVLVRDITERVHAQEALEASLRSKDQLIASISHELRTPLTAVVGFAQLLKDEASGLSPTERAEMISSIADEGADLTNIVEDLLTAANIQAGTLTVVHVPVDLRHQAAQVLEIWPHYQAGHIELTGSAVRAIGDPARVRQIIRNLISNALRYGGNRTWINVNSDQTTNRVAVCDNGSGVPPDQQERIFEPYQRAHDTPGLTASLGLGLTVARQLARRMGGDLTYRHQPDETTFELTLPIAT